MYPEEIVTKLKEARMARSNWMEKLSKVQSQESMADVVVLFKKYKQLQGLAKHARHTYMVNWQRRFGGTSIEANKIKVRSSGKYYLEIRWIRQF